MDTTELRRSTLERKDREHLTTIATSLGVKPPSRARKAEIVDLILTTVATDAADGSEDAESKASEPLTYHAGDEDDFDFGEVTDKRSSDGGAKSKSTKRNKKGGGGDGSSEEGSRPRDRGQQRQGNDQTERGNRRSRRRPQVPGRARCQGPRRACPSGGPRSR